MPSQAYFKNLRFTTVRQGCDPVILVINGFLSASEKDVTDWLSITKQLYPENQVVHVQWQAGSVKEMVLADGLTGLGKEVLSTTARNLFKGEIVSSLMSVGAIAADKVAGHWKQSMENAQQAGEQLAEYLDASFTGKDAILLGHSLGARVIYNTLLNLTNTGCVQASYLLGGAVSSEHGDWQQVWEKLPSLTLVNCYSNKDQVLNWLYRLGTLFGDRPCGLQQLAEDRSNSINIDLSEQVSGHMEYKCTTTGQYLAWFLNTQVLVSNACHIAQLSQSETLNLTGLFEKSVPPQNNEAAHISAPVKTETELSLSFIDKLRAELNLYP
ncbi:DUF726 domain-containing protein [Endozoicomonas sp. ALB115]|uniref:DUF726 domain-containing protein n=1 Tax=Endozoicomonas sp. ALB115 TaxID=3403074 RepID=UPI003BB6ADCB